MNDITHSEKKSLQSIFKSHYHEKYSFEDFLNFDQEKEFSTIEIDTKKGAKKEIFKPSDKLQDYLRFLNNYIFQYADTNTNVVYSYRKGTNPYQAVVKHSANNFFFQADIKGFFSSVKRQDIEYVLNNKLAQSPISDLNIYINRILNLIMVNDSLPIGFASSPILTNSLLNDFDNELEKYCLDQDVIYTRYSDDLILSAKTKTPLINLEDYISEMLVKFFNERLKLNEEKTKLTQKGNKIKILGMVILPTGKVTVDIKVKKNIEILFHYFINDKNKFVDISGGNYEAALDKLSGKINYINTIDPDYLIKLRKKYGNYIVDMFFHKSY
ncbi:reverse transcriptase domain-containing protein [Psychromonas sp. SA13A]|uniref:reverse transcriptase domain-containing protein n=1 Tax=Psychromonas sp. SA13A TaxID=2686346 RepID=UPI001407BF78|nr:reverse transcriptase domain-containing protein [Psychromonas sp. SA13A]